eukprot:SAG11_NODE_8504_length_1008_cov_1.705171_2_plen_55_part_00
METVARREERKGERKIENRKSNLIEIEKRPPIFWMRVYSSGEHSYKEYIGFLAS